MAKGDNLWTFSKQSVNQPFSIVAKGLRFLRKETNHCDDSEYPIRLMDLKIKI